jgi:hypothetical protein
LIEILLVTEVLDELLFSLVEKAFLLLLKKPASLLLFKLSFPPLLYSLRLFTVRTTE